MLSNRWFILSVIFLARISMGYQFQSIGSVSPSLIKEFAIEYAAIGTLIGLTSLPGLFLSLPSGFLGNRFGPGFGLARRQKSRINDYDKKDLTLLHGVPVSIKDVTLTAGIRTAFGSKLYEILFPTRMP